MFWNPQAIRILKNSSLKKKGPCSFPGWSEANNDRCLHADGCTYLDIEKKNTSILGFSRFILLKLTHFYGTVINLTL